MSQLVSPLLALPAIRPAAALSANRADGPSWPDAGGQRHDHAGLHPLLRARGPQLGGDRVGARVGGRAAYEQVLTSMGSGSQIGLGVAFLIGVVLVILRRSGGVVRQQATRGWPES